MNPEMPDANILWKADGATNTFEKAKVLNFSSTTEFLKSPNLLNLGVGLAATALAWEGIKKMVGASGESAEKR